MVRTVIGATGGIVGVLSALLAAGWVGAVLLTAVVGVFVGAMCWVINDPYRPERLALLITSWRTRGADKAAP
jgi:hypothetical protein